MASNPEVSIFDGGEVTLQPGVTVRLVGADEAPPWVKAIRDRCPCGYAGANILTTPRAHERWHLRWAQGIEITKTVWRDDRHLLVVPANARMPAQRLAHEMARLFMWEGHYDFPLFYAQHGRRNRRPTAYVALLESRAIGLAVITDVDRWGWWHKADREGVIHFDEHTPAVMVAGIFVCANYRRAGVARWLIAEVARRERVPVRELVWQSPFSKAGRALALAMAGEMALRIG